MSRIKVAEPNKHHYRNWICDCPEMWVKFENEPECEDCGKQSNHLKSIELKRLRYAVRVLLEKDASGKNKNLKKLKKRLGISEGQLRYALYNK